MKGHGIFPDDRPQSGGCFVIARPRIAMSRFRIASLLLVALIGPAAAPAAPPSKADLVAAGATVKQDDAGAIVEVRFAGPAVDPAVLATLPELPALQSVVLAGTDATDAALVPLGTIATLKNLDLRDCRISNAGLAHLVNLKQLAALRLSGKSGATTVDDAGMAHVAKLTSLRALMLDFLWVSEAGLQTLAGRQRVAPGGGQVVRGQPRVEVLHVAARDRDGGVLDHEPEESLENQQPAERDDERRDALADNERAHQRPQPECGDKGRAHRNGGRPALLEHEHRRDAADQPDAAADREIDLPGEQNHEHPERQRARDRELDDELREVARPEKRGLLHREE